MDLIYLGMLEYHMKTGSAIITLVYNSIESLPICTIQLLTAAKI